MTPEKEDGFDVKKARLDDPSGWIKLTRYESVRLIVDALLESPPGYKFNKSELARRAGINRESVREHIDLLLDLGLIEKDESGEWAEFRLNDDGKVTRELLELNSAINSVLAGQPKNVKDEPHLSDVAELLDYSSNAGKEFEMDECIVNNARRESKEGDTFMSSPDNPTVTNAD